MAKSKKQTFDAELVSGVGSYVKDKVKRQILKWTEISVLVLLALIMISFGVATLVGQEFPNLNNVLNFILLGMVYLVASILIRM